MTLAALARAALETASATATSEVAADAFRIVSVRKRKNG